MKETLHHSSNLEKKMLQVHAVVYSMENHQNRIKVQLCLKIINNK